MAIRVIFSLFASVFLLWVASDIRLGEAIPMYRPSIELVTWARDPFIYVCSVGFRAIVGFGLMWVALFHDFGKPKTPKKERISRRKERQNKKP